MIDNERTRSVQPLIEAVYSYHGAGGNLHIVLDDNNLEDDNLEFCAEQIAVGGYKGRARGHDSAAQLAAEQVCLDAFRAMTLEERISAMGIWDGCWGRA